MGGVYRDERISTELMTTTVAKPQGVKLKEADSKPSGRGALWAGRPEEHEPAVRPGAGGKLAGNSEAQKSSETHQVEPDGTRGKILHLTWGDLLRESGEEVSRRRSSEEAG